MTTTLPGQDGSLSFDYGEPIRPTQAAPRANEPLTVATAPTIVISVSVSDGTFGIAPDADALVSGTWDNGYIGFSGAL
jgi:hypothetical protein